MKKYTFTEKKDTRSGFGDGLTELGRTNPNVVALCADLIGSLKMQNFIDENPERFFQIGIAEANMMGMVALMESPVGYLQRQFNYSRLKSTIIVVFLVWWLGIGTVFSYSIWQDNGFTIALFFGDEAVRLVNNAGFHDVLVFLSSYLIQPIVALFLCLFVAWVIPRELSFKELDLPGRHWFEIWNYLVRYITPVLLLVVFLKAIGVF